MIENDWSYQYQEGSLLICFGKKGSSIKRWEASFPETKAFHLKQVHGQEILSTKQIEDYKNQNLPPQADGLWTDISNQALGVITADCIPLFLWDKNQSLVMGLHAGWRGVAGKILHQGLNIFEKEGLSLKELRFAIGPHISQENFEVEEDVLQQILSSVNQKDTSSLFIGRNQGRFLVNLLEILKLQIDSFGISRKQIIELPIDTYSNQSFHSFRKDRGQAGRQISFIVKRGSL